MRRCSRWRMRAARRDGPRVDAGEGQALPELLDQRGLVDLGVIREDAREARDTSRCLGRGHGGDRAESRPPLMRTPVSPSGESRLAHSAPQLAADPFCRAGSVAARGSWNRACSSSSPRASRWRRGAASRRGPACGCPDRGLRSRGGCSWRSSGRRSRGPAGAAGGAAARRWRTSLAKLTVPRVPRAGTAT